MIKRHYVNVYAWKNILKSIDNCFNIFNFFSLDNK